MAEQWTDAQTVRGHFAVLLSTPDGLRGFCHRAEAGWTESRARVLLRGEQPSENVGPPAVFWGFSAAFHTERNWETGDFFGTLDGTEWQAFGITFGLSGVLGMLPAEQYAAIQESARNLRT